MEKRSIKDFSGFTLIELLVVVLIIGILAAVAVPQYQRAVEKSRAAQAFVLVKSFYEAAENYYLANGQWPTRFDELDISAPWSDDTGERSGASVSDIRSNEDWALELMSDASYEGIMMRRKKGLYEGCQIKIFKKHQSPRLTGWLCSEPLSLSEGSFCQKFFNGRYMTKGVVREYSI